MDISDPRFSGIGRLYGVENLKRFHSARVCIVGLGGVGTWVAESLVRSGIGHFVLVDLDDICVTNTNRQIHALEGTHGRSKVAAMAERMRLISPSCDVVEHEGFYTEKSSEQIFAYGCDLVIDAIDSFLPKCHLIAACYHQGVPLITCGGAGGRTDASRIRCDDLACSCGDPLLSRVRKQLRKEYALPLEDKAGKIGIPCVFSPEKPVFPTCDGGTSSERDPAYAAGRMSCEAGFGSATHITGTFGFFMAGLALQKLSASLS